MKRVKVYPPCPECMDPEMKKGGNWIQKATKSIERRGTEGKCTGSNFGGPGCPPGSKQYVLAQNFRKMAKSRKKEYGGDVADQNVGIDEFGSSRLNSFKDYIAGQARDAFTQNVLMNMPETYPGIYQGGGNTAHGYGYNPDLVDINQFLDQEENINNQLRDSFNQLGNVMQLSPYMPTEWKAKTKFNRHNPNYKQNRDTYGKQEEGYKNWKETNDILAGFQHPYLQMGGDLPKHQTTGITATPPTTTTYTVRGTDNPAMQNANWIETWHTWNSPPEYLEMYNSYRRNGGRESLDAFIKGPDGKRYMDMYYHTQSSTGTTTDGTASTNASTNNAPITEVKKAQGVGTGTNKSIGTNKSTGNVSTNNNQVSHDQATGTPVTVADALEARRRGNADPKTVKKLTGTGTGTSTTTGEKESESKDYGYYGEHGYPSIIYPKMGFLNQRTGMLPLILDPRSTHIEDIKFRRALLPGNRIKKITFSHDLNPYGQYPGSDQTQTTTTTNNDESWRTPQLRYPKYDKPVGETPEEQARFDQQERMMRENPRAFGIGKRIYGGSLPIAQSGIDWKLKYEQDQDRFRDEVTGLPENFFTPNEQQNNMFAGLRDRFGDWRDQRRTDREKQRANAARGDLRTEATPYNPIMRAALLDPVLGIATSIGRKRTMGDFDIADKTAYDAIGTVRQRPVMGDFDFNPTGRIVDPTKYAPVQNKGFSMKCGGKVRKFQQGGSYELTDQEIDDLIASGIGFEYLD